MSEETTQILPGRLKKNIAANFAGTFWQSLMGILFVPVYIKFIGIEAYGLIAIFGTVQVIMGLLDVGLGNTLTRELARLSALKGKEQESRDLVRTLETIYWCIAAAAGLIIIFLSPLLASHWIQAENLSTEIVQQAVLIMGLIIVFQMPNGFYSGGLMGLQKQVLLNVINIVIGTLRGAGAVIVIWLYSSTIQAFLLWQLGISILNTVAASFFLWKNLPDGGNRSSFQKNLLKGVWKFAAGMSGISILAVILTQLDKIILSKMLSLEMFGYYSLASLVAMSLARLFTPVFFSIYPRFTQLVSANNIDELRLLYHKSSQLLAVLILPIAIVIALFSYEIIFLWTQNAATAEKTHLLISILISGTAINGLLNPPYALQLAFGWTGLSVIKNIIAVIVFTPLIVLLTTNYGAIGAASAWLVLNAGYLFFEIPVMHSRILPNDMWRWYIHDVGLPVIAGFSFASLGRVVFNSSVSQPMVAFNVLALLILTVGITIVSAPSIRKILREVFRKRVVFTTNR